MTYQNQSDGIEGNGTNVLGEKDVRNRKLLKSTAAVAAPTLLSRIFGALRDIFQAKYLGTGMGADAFSIAFVLPNLLRRLTAEGAMTAAFIPVFTQLKKEETKEKLWKFANIFFFDLTLIMALLTVSGILLSPILVKIVAPGFGDIQGKWDLTILLTRIMFPYIFLISLAALAMAILNSFHKFFVPAFTPVLFNLAIITAAVLFAKRAEEPAFVFAFGIVAGGVLQLGFQIPFLWKKGMRFRPGLSFQHPAIRKVGKLMVPGIFGAGIYQFNFVISRVIASFLEEGSNSSLYYASRIQELTLGLFSIALSIALLPTFSEQAAKKDISGIKQTLDFSLKLVAMITIPAMLGLLMLKTPIIQVVYQRGEFNDQSTIMTASCLFYFAFGLPFLSGVKILAPVFYSLKDTKTPVKVAFVVMIIYVSSALILINPLSLGGIALALSLSSMFNFFFLFLLLQKKIGPIPKKALLVSVGKALLFAGFMGISIGIFIRGFDLLEIALLPRIGILLAAILMGIGIYLFLHYLFNREELKGLKRILTPGKFKRNKIK